jgi:hypothetical protein
MSFKLSVGVIESNNDPLKIGRLQVRIFDVHDDDIQKVPTKDLPWAQVVYSTNNSKSSAIPAIGEWVLCSFLDEESGQVPVIIGVLPGLVSKYVKQPTSSDDVIRVLEAKIAAQQSELNTLQEDKNPSETTRAQISSLTTQITEDKATLTKLQQQNNSVPQRGFNDTSTQAAANKRPKQPGYSKENTVGQPSLPVASRTVVGTSLDFINSQLTHECDTTAYVRRAVSNATGLARQIALAIRNALKALLKTLGSSPAGAGLASIVKSITKQIKRITYWIRQINKFLNDVVKAVAEIMAVINYILSLPAKLIALFQKCLNEALAELKRGVFDIVSSVTSVGDGVSLGDDVKSMVAATKELATATVTLANFPTTATAQLAAGSNLSDTEKDALLATIFPNSLKYDANSYEVPG